MNFLDYELVKSYSDNFGDDLYRRVANEAAGLVWYGARSHEATDRQRRPIA